MATEDPRETILVAQQGQMAPSADVFEQYNGAQIAAWDHENILSENERSRRLNVAKFQACCDTVANKATECGLTEDKLTAILASDH